MPILQYNMFMCEKCHKTHTTYKEVAMHSDPVVTPEQSGWDYHEIDGQEVLLCPQRAAKLPPAQEGAQLC